MEQRNVDKINALIQRWGVPMQLIMTGEEMAGLIHVCSKLLRGSVSRAVLVDALADAYVMLQTMCMIYNVRGEELEAVITAKLDRGLQVPLPQQAAPAAPPVNQDAQATAPADKPQEAPAK